MKRSVLAAGLAALVAQTALAQGAPGPQSAALTMYGIVDVAVERISAVGSPGSSLYRVPSQTGAVPSRWGLRASEDLGGGLRALLTLEQGLAPDNGSLAQGLRGMGRQAFVGLAGPWGTVSFGRQYTMLFWSLLEADVMGPALYGSGSLDAYIPNARVDNSVAWRGSFGGLSLGATYSLGRDGVAANSPAGTNCPGEQADDPKACREWSVLAKFDQPRWGVALALDEFRGGPNAFAGLVSSTLTDRRLSANGYARFGDFKAALGLIRRDNRASATAPRSNIWYAGGTYALSPAWTLDVELLRLSFQANANRATLGTARVTYAFSRRTSVYLTAGRIDNDGALAISVSAGAPGSNPAAGAAQTALAAGLRQVF